MDVRTKEIDDQLENVYQGSISQDEVSNLLGEIQGAKAIQDGEAMAGGVGVGAIANQNPSFAQKNDVDEMQAKLDQLKNM